METKKRIAVGKSDFKSLIEENHYFIDKSLLVEEIINDGAKIILLLQPRWFGETLNLSMLRCFFENMDTDNRKRLFVGLEIEKARI